MSAIFAHTVFPQHSPGICLLHRTLCMCVCARAIVCVCGRVVARVCVWLGGGAQQSLENKGANATKTI